MRVRWWMMTFASTPLLVLAMTGTAPAVSTAHGARITRLAAGRQSKEPATRQQAGTGARPEVLLINGTRLVAGQLPGGPPVALLPGSGPSGILGLRLGGPDGRQEEIPVDALPYLGRNLDLSLFDLGALQRAETAGRLPVRIGYAERLPALPGVTVTRTWAGGAAGYLTTAGARRFGAALARQFSADEPTASYGAGGLFADGVRISLPGARGPARTPVAPRRPRFRLRTLTMTASDLLGRPDSGGSVFVFNADDPARFESSGVFSHGMARFSVPARRAARQSHPRPGDSRGIRRMEKAHSARE